jgi:hypothetical protein
MTGHPSEFSKSRLSDLQDALKYRADGSDCELQSLGYPRWRRDFCRRNIFGFIKIIDDPE